LFRPPRRSRLVACGTALVAILSGPAAAARQADPDAILSRALVLHESGDLAGAAALYVQVLRIFPGAARIRSNLGAAYAGLGRYEDAIEQYRRALEGVGDGEGATSIRHNLALALQKAGQTGEAAGEARRVLDTEPANRDALLLLADCQLRLGQHEALIELLGPVAAADPADKAVAFLLGTALLEVGRPGDAQVVMDRVFRDDSPPGHVLMGLMHSKRQNWEGVLAEAEKARAADPRVPLANFLYGQALLKSVEQSRMMQPVDWQGAVEAFRAELSIDPNHFESNLLLGTLLREEGKTGEALDHLRRAARLRPDDLAVRFSLGAACVSAGRLEEARDLLEPVARAAPSHLPTQVQLAVVYSRLGESEKAAAARRMAVQLQKEADARSMEGAAEVVSQLLGKSSSPADEAARHDREPE